MAEQGMIVFQYFNNVRIGFVDMQASEQFGVSQKHTVATHWVIYWQVVSDADNIIILTMTRRGMHRSCARFGGNRGPPE